MTTVLINAIDGTGTYAVPSTDAALLAAKSGLDGILGAVAGLSYARLNAWVISSSSAPGTRTLNCYLDGVT